MLSSSYIETLFGCIIVVLFSVDLMPLFYIYKSVFYVAVFLLGQPTPLIKVLPLAKLFLRPHLCVKGRHRGIEFQRSGISRLSTA